MFNFSRSEHEKKVFVLGLDGVPCALLRRFMSQGIMKNLSSIAGKGSLISMDASLPEVSSTSWTTFMTGVNPGRHGIYGFMDFQKGSYEIYLPRFTDVKSPTLWDILGKYGKRSVVLNIPSTYPARPLNGVLASGFVAIELERAVYPRNAFEYLKGIGYRMDVDTDNAKHDIEAFKKDVDITFEKRKEAFSHFIDKEKWDLCVAVITETDRLHHFFFDGLSDTGHPMHEYLIDFYKKIDSLIGEFYAKAKKHNAVFIIVSDHGFTDIKKEISLNGWLRDNGYLRFKSADPTSLSELSGESVAFALDPSRVYLNLEGKFPLGCVCNKEYCSLREKIKHGLLNFTLDGENVIQEVFFKEQLYHGECIESAPDIVLLAKEGFDLKGAIRKKEHSGRVIFAGAHTRGDATLYMDRNLRPDNERVNIIDMAPTILHLLGIEKEIGALDGKIITEH